MQIADLEFDSDICRSLRNSYFGLKSLLDIYEHALCMNVSCKFVNDLDAVTCVKCQGQLLKIARHGVEIQEDGTPTESNVMRPKEKLARILIQDAIRARMDMRKDFPANIDFSSGDKTLRNGTCPAQHVENSQGCDVRPNSLCGSSSCLHFLACSDVCAQSRVLVTPGRAILQGKLSKCNWVWTGFKVRQLPPSQSGVFTSRFSTCLPPRCSYNRISYVKLNTCKMSLRVGRIGSCMSLRLLASLTSRLCVFSFSSFIRCTSACLTTYKNHP